MVVNSHDTVYAYLYGGVHCEKPVNFQHFHTHRIKLKLLPYLTVTLQDGIYICCIKTFGNSTFGIVLVNDIQVFLVGNGFLDEI